MKLGIIAAGRGERLARGGILTPKPLVSVGGRPLIARVIDAGAALGVSSIACIVNELSSAVIDYLRSPGWPVPVDLVVKTTPSSMESLFCLAPYLADEPFLLSTVDVVCGARVLERFVTEARTLDDSAGALALTRHVDDEKPLWVAVDGRNRISAMGNAAGNSGIVTAGFYYFRPHIFAEIDAARAMKLNALRQFLGHLVDRGYPLHGVMVPKTIDVDVPEDIEKAEAYLKEANAT